MIPKPTIDSTKARYTARNEQRAQTAERLRAGSPLQADSPERVRKRMAHIAESEMARAVAPSPARDLGERGDGAITLLERIIGDNDLMSITFLDLAVRVAQTVGRVQIRNTSGQLIGYGTGFLIGPRVLITNNHVLGSAADSASSSIEFNYQDTLADAAPASVVFGLDPGSLFFTDKALDYTVVAVRERSSTAELSTFGYNRLVEQEGKVLVGECLNIIQHPNGEPKQLALRENRLIDVLPQFVHYQTDTAPGSSGSPVFNDQWEVVALHHSGIPHTDAEGRYLTKSGTLWTPAMGEHKIDWIANEGARVSQIVASLKGAAGFTATARSLRDSILNPKSPLEMLPKSAVAQTTPPGPAPYARQASDDAACVIGPDDSATWTLPVRISVRVGHHRADTVATMAATPMTSEPAAPSVQTSDLLFERMVAPVIDNHYANRKGYDEHFLGVPIPLPRVTNENLVSKMDDGGFVIPYEHFSIVMHKRRRLALFTASNVDGRRRSKEPESGRDYSRRGLTGLGPHDIEQWVSDPRIPEEHQLPDIFFTEDRQSFDKGHIVRREDVCWGRSYAMVRRANGDTFHTTNCSPQVKRFNQSSQDGIWGQLEDFIAAQAKSETYCIFAGPVFADDDEEFAGRDTRGPVTVRIPSRFWKVLVANTDGLQSFAFVLEQDLSGVSFRDEFAVDTTWAERLVSMADLERLLEGIELPRIITDNDQFGRPLADEITRRHRESLGLDSIAAAGVR